MWLLVLLILVEYVHHHCLKKEIHSCRQLVPQMFDWIKLGTDHLTWRGGYGFLFRSECFFRTTQELEYFFFFCRAQCKFFFQNLTLGYMTKTLNQINFFFLHQNQNIFFSNIGNQNIFLEKNHIKHVSLYHCHI